MIRTTRRSSSLAGSLTEGGMDKQMTLQAVRELVAQGALTKEEVLVALGVPHAQEERTTRMAEILYYIGGAIVAIGIAVLIGQNWDQLPSLARIVSTLGAGLAAYVVAVLLTSKKEFEKVARAFFLIAGIVLPIGLNVAFYEGGYRVSTPAIQSVIFALLLALFVASYSVYRRVVLLIFAMIAGVALYYVFTSYLPSGRPIFSEPEFTEYRTLLAGLAVGVLGYHFGRGTSRAITGSLYGFGSLAFLGAALALSGYKPEQNMFWELIFPALAFGVIFLSVPLKSKSLLVIGSLYLMGYIIKITTEYFSDSLGWPLALVIAGLFIIGIGYGSLTINRRYLRA